MAPSARSQSGWQRWWFPGSLTGLTLLLLPGIALLIVNLFGWEPQVNGWMKEKFGLTYHLTPPWWASLLLFLVPLLLLLLYFLKMRRQAQQVPSTFLWRKSVEDMRVNSLFQWLRQNVLLLLQLLTVVLLIYAVMQFQKHGGFGEGKHYILVIDSSASMAATDVQPTRLDVAKAEALAEIDRHGDNDPGMVIDFNSRAATRQSYTTDRSLMRAAVNRVVQTQQTTSIVQVLSQINALSSPRGSAEDQAVRPANELPGQARTYVAAEGISAEVHIFSDGCFEVPKEDFDASRLALNFHPVGQPGARVVDNVGIVALDASRDDKKTGPDTSTRRIFATIRNYRASECSVKVMLKWQLQDDPEFHEREQTVNLRGRTDAETEIRTGVIDTRCEENVSFELTNIALSGVVIATVWLAGHHDQFALDDKAWIVVGRSRKMRIAVVSEGNDPEADTIGKQLAGNKLLRDFFNQPAMAQKADVRGLRPADLNDKVLYLDPAAEGRYDLVIFDRCAPPTEATLPKSNTWFIFDVPPPWKKSALRPLQNVEIKNATSLHPLMKHVLGLDEINFTEAFRFEDLPPPRQRLLETGAARDAGDSTNDDTAVMFVLNRGQYRDLIQAFPLVDDKNQGACTNWFKKVTFPTFLDNVVEDLGGVKTLSPQEILRPGNKKTFRPGTGASEVSVLPVDVVNGPLATRPVELEPAGPGEFQYKEVDRLGLYRAYWPGGEEFFAVNLLDRNESDIQRRESIQLGTQQVTATEAGGQPRDLWKWVALTALGLLLLEWFLYHQRFFL